MFRSIDLTNFQSHKNTHLPLGAFTVIVGPSSSGKSAVVRALTLVAQNARGTSYVRQGAKTSVVSLELRGSEPVLDASTVVSVERGKSTSVYTLRVPGMHDEPVVFTKCASSTPDAVVQALELGDTKLWIAGQFDTPFLLGETGAEVARVLGRLTNVDMIYAASRETNRRTGEARRMHSLRVSELSEARSQISLYATLPVRLAAGREAEARLSAAELAATERATLLSAVRAAREAMGRAEVARSVRREPVSVERLTVMASERSALSALVRDAKAAQRRREEVLIPSGTVPDLRTVRLLLADRASLKTALGDAARVIAARSELRARARVSREAADAARDSFREALTGAGECPLCGASADHAQVDRVV